MKRYLHIYQPYYYAMYISKVPHEGQPKMFQWMNTATVSDLLDFWTEDAIRFPSQHGRVTKQYRERGSSQVHLPRSLTFAGTVALRSLWDNSLIPTKNNYEECRLLLLENEWPNSHKKFV